MKRAHRAGWLTVTFVFLLGIGSMGWAADVRLAIGTASTGGTWYPLGGGVGAMINKYVKGYQAAAHPSGASIENIRAIMKKQDALSLSMPDTAFQAYKGLEAFEGKATPDLRGLMATYPIDIQFFALAGGPIKTIKDLKGKKVAVGAPGSGEQAREEVVDRAVVEHAGRDGARQRGEGFEHAAVERVLQVLQRRARGLDDGRRSRVGERRWQCETDMACALVQDENLAGEGIC